MKIVDIHTHRPDAPSALLSLPPSQVTDFPGVPVSTGIHPWSTGDDVDFELLDRVAALPQVLAIGETGLDKLRGAPIERQLEIFRHHVQLSERLAKPMIIHCVKAWDQLLSVKREMQPMQRWAIHGFRGNERLAQQLIDNGFYLSLGEKFNEQSARIIPTDRLLAETDESQLPISEIISRIAAARGSHHPLAPTAATFLTPIPTPAPPR